MGYTAHDTGLYYIGRGTVFFDRYINSLPTGMRDLGNCPDFRIAPTVEELTHYSSRTGLKVKDKTVTLSAEGVVRFTLDEYDIDNLTMAVLGTKLTQRTIALFQDPTLEGHLRFVGDPAAGPDFQVDLWNVKLKPTSEIPFISDEWSTIEFEAEIQSDVDNHPTCPYGQIELIYLS